MKSSKHATTVLFLSAVISAGIIAYALAHYKAKQPHYSTFIFLGSNGWGYDILLNSRIIIHQESIPSIGNHQGFPLKEQAEKAANLVLKKLNANESLPTLTRFELAEICPSIR